MQIEKRTIPSEVRTESAGGKIYLTGRAASYGVMSHDLGGWREILAENAFDDALAADDLDVVHTVNHDMNRVLGRSKSGTLTLSTSRKGLNYKTLLPQTGYARDVTELCRRGDISASSFAFVVADDGENWTDIDDPEQEGKRCALRTITRVAKLHDVATVVSPAYPGTIAGVADRSLVPSSMPTEFRARILSRAADDECQCDCAECEADDCPECSNPDCDDEDCRCEYSMRSDDADNGSWKRSAIDLFSKLKDLSDDEKGQAWKELQELAAKYGIDVDDDSRAARARRLELAMIE